RRQRRKRGRSATAKRPIGTTKHGQAHAGAAGYSQGPLQGQPPARATAYRGNYPQGQPTAT
ncbi:hypothetical protein GW17_00046367, partial [Ensete ventricosum]